jgi:hypothetical protein
MNRPADIWTGSIVHGGAELHAPGVHGAAIDNPLPGGDR